MNTPLISMKILLKALLVIVVALCAGGCLTAERKEIVYSIKPDGSGSGRITFYNIISLEEDAKDVSLSDYTELVNKYLKGNRFEEYYPYYTNFKKRLFEQNGKLNGEITFDFASYEDVGLFRFQNKGPWMYFIGVKSDFGVDRFDTSNGTVGGEQMPVVFWPEETSEFRISSKFDQSDLAAHPLVALYKRIGID